MTKTEEAILTVLKRNQRDIIGSTQIMRALAPYGINLTERSIRYHLKLMDQKKLTEVFGKSGRRITDKGLSELELSNVSGKIGFISSKIESLSYMSDFDYEKQCGKVIMNISIFAKSQVREAMGVLSRAFASKYVMSRLVIIADEGQLIGSTMVPEAMVGIGTICSVTVNAVLLNCGIPISSRYGGVMEVTPDGPARFTSLISYDGCSLDPLIVFINSGMTSVSDVLESGRGHVLASFREVPVVCIDKTRQIQEKLNSIDIGGLLLIGGPNTPLLEVPVGLDKAGVVVVGGLNPVAALYENQIQAESFAMSELVEYGDLIPYADASGMFS